MNRILLLPPKVLPISHLLLPINALPISYFLLPLNALPISHFLLPINLLTISHLLLPLNALPLNALRTKQSPAAVVTRHTSDQSSKSTPLATVTLPKKHQETEAKLDDQRQNGKEKGQCSIRREQHKSEKRAVSRKTKTKQRRKMPIRPRNGNGRIKKSLWRKRNVL